MFTQLRPLLRIGVELRRIATCLEYFAVTDARAKGLMFTPATVKRFNKDESELLHSDDRKIITSQTEKIAKFLQGGARLLDQEEND